MRRSSTSGAGYASTARGSRLAGAGGAIAATGLLLAALWIGLAVRDRVAPDSALRVFDVPLSAVPPPEPVHRSRSEEHPSELQSLMRISYAVFCLKKKRKTHTYKSNTQKIKQEPQ